MILKSVSICYLPLWGFKKDFVTSDEAEYLLRNNRKHYEVVEGLKIISVYLLKRLFMVAIEISKEGEI